MPTPKPIPTPDAAPAPDLDRIAAWLARREQALCAEVDAARSPAAATPAFSHDVTDRKEEAGLRMDTALRDAELERDLDELRQVRAARARLAEGLYGHCTGCEAPIPLARLQAQPTALRCLACQAATERHAPA